MFVVALWPRCIAADACTRSLAVCADTEIDWIAYMEEVAGFLGGDLDYANLKGQTGPLVSNETEQRDDSLLQAEQLMAHLSPLSRCCCAGLSSWLRVHLFGALLHHGSCESLALARRHLFQCGK